MYRRIIVIAFLLLSFMCLSVNGQTAIAYSYDSAGNRTSRTTVEATNVVSVLSEMSIDANDQLGISLPATKASSNIASLAFGEVDEKAWISHTCIGDLAENLPLSRMILLGKQEKISVGFKIWIGIPFGKADFLDWLTEGPCPVTSYQATSEG